MVKAPAILLLSLALAGCAAAPQARLASDPAFKATHYAWDGAGEDPNRPRPVAEPLRSTRGAARSSPAQDEVAADEDEQLRRLLVICKGCLRPQPTANERLAKAGD